MFFELVRRNSRRSRKENGLFFASLLITIAAFYMILSLSQQDVIHFLRQMESQAVDKLLGMIPFFYGVTLFILFFLIYFASKYQLQRRSHEFGVYLIMGMRRSKLFFMLLAEDLWSSLLSLLVGLPAAVFLSEVISLLTVRVVGIGILGHRFTFSIQALAGTVAGFVFIKLLAFVILSSKISSTQIGNLLAPEPESTRKQLPSWVYAAAFVLGCTLLGTAYVLAVKGVAWEKLLNMAVTVVLGLAGTFLLFFGLRSILGIFAALPGKIKGLHTFTFRQLQENVICQSASMAVSSLLILAALCCFGFGVSTAWSYTGREEHVIDYTFHTDYGNIGVMETLEDSGISKNFEKLFQMKVGRIQTEDWENAYEMQEVMDLLDKEPQSQEKDVLKNNLGYEDYPYLIALSGYNALLECAHEKPLELKAGQAGVYMDAEFANAGRKTLMDRILKQEPQVHMEGQSCTLTGSLQTTNLVVDRSITLSFALIVPDEFFQQIVTDQYDVYWNGILSPGLLENSSLMEAISQVNEQLGDTGLIYESYLQNMGRQLFYVVAASYLTLYLAVIFLVIANTIIGVQFLMQQQKTGKRYRTLIRLGSCYEELCASAKKQIRWYFGIPVLAAGAGSFFGVKALFAGMLPPGIQSQLQGLLVIALAMIIFLCVIEWCYMTAVIRASRRQILAMMEPVRDE